ncbi:MAG: BrnT family toxin [Pseudomonadota bacterium]|nr:BrnT family toxin [Pseudomonadota bacterium]
MKITFDAGKQDRTLQEHGLDFADAGEIFSGKFFTAEDVRQNYGEIRFVSVGRLGGRTVVVVWTPRGDAHHIISMRKANEREQERYARHLD